MSLESTLLSVRRLIILTCICIWQKTFSDPVNRHFHRLGSSAVFDRLFLVWTRIRQCAFFLLHLDLAAHVRSEVLAELLKVNVPNLVGVKDILHQSLDLFLGGLDFDLFQMSLEILVADETISIDVESLKKLVSGWFSGIRGVFNLYQDFSNPLSVSVMAFNFDRLGKSDVFVDVIRWWICSYLAS